ncbi:MAG TPA: protein kinase, partial [Myxococcota bacterium]
MTEGGPLAERYGDFELLRLIATGGMAEIYLAKHDSFGGFTRTVVVKRMLPQLAVRPDFVQMFLDEGKLAANLNHENIVKVFDLGEVEHGYFIAMEFVDGPHLGSLFAHSLRMRKPLPIELCCYIVARAADGLHYAHEQNDPATGQQLNLVHRDISPQNVLVSRQGDVKVTDFGVAKASTQQTKTRTGIIKGKVAYMSPEQCLGEVVDRRTDVFALGIVLYELLTRRRLFRDKSDLLIMQKITGEDVAAPSSVNKELDAAYDAATLDAICQKALARARDQRYADAGELAEALDVWLAARPKAVDQRTALARWLEQNAIELTLGTEVTTGSQPSYSATAQVRASAQEPTSATPSLNSAETVMRVQSSPGRALPHGTSRGDAPAVRPAMAARPEEALPSRTAGPGASLEDELTQRAPRPGDGENTLSSPSSPAAPHSDLKSGANALSPTPNKPASPMTGSPMTDPGDFTSVARSVDLDAPSSPSAQAGLQPDLSLTGPLTPAPAPRRLPLMAAVGAIGLMALVAVVVVIVKHGDKSGGTPDTTALAVDAGVAAAADSKLAKLTLESVPPVELLVDGKSVGKSPATVDHAAGHMKVQALFDDQAPVTEEIDVAAGEERSVRVLAKVPLVVKSTPPGAKVRVDGGDVEGVTPLTRAGRL